MPAQIATNTKQSAGTNIDARSRARPAMDTAGGAAAGTPLAEAERDDDIIGHLSGTRRGFYENIYDEHQR